MFKHQLIAKASASINSALDYNVKSMSKMSIALLIGICLATGATAQSVPIPKAKPDYKAAAKSAGGATGFQSIGSTATTTGQASGAQATTSVESKK